MIYYKYIIYKKNKNWYNKFIKFNWFEIKEMEW